MVRTIILLMSIIFILPGLVESNDEQVEFNVKQFSCEEYPQIIEKIKADDLLSIYIQGVLYYKGKCVEKDDKQAFLFFAAAAQRKHIPSFYNLALMYHLGVGVEPDVKKATDMFRQLLEIKHLDTQRYVCDSYLAEGFNSKWIEKYNLSCGAIRKQ